MKIKKIISSLIAMTITLTANCSTAYANIEDKGKLYNVSGYDVSSAQSKPKLEVTKKVFDTVSEAAGQTVTITLTLNGENVDGKYCTTNVHVSWDDRLKIVSTGTGNYAKVATGDDAAISELPCEQRQNGINSVILRTVGKSDVGNTGRMWTIDLQVPYDAKEGEVFPIDVYYDDTAGLDDCFTNSADDTEGKLMQAYFFTKGINSKENPSDDEYLQAANATFADGYIAIGKPNTSYYPIETSTTSALTTTTTTTKSESSLNDNIVKEIRLSKNEINLNVGQKDISYLTMLPETATDKGEVWTTSDPKVATVDTWGNITAVGSGTCTVTVTSKQNQSVKADIKVTVGNKATISTNAPTLGDFSGDGVIDGRDATDILTLYAKSSSGGNTVTDEEMNKGDVTKDGVLDGRDATAVLTYYAKISAGEKITFDEFQTTEPETVPKTKNELLPLSEVDNDGKGNESGFATYYYSDNSIIIDGVITDGSYGLTTYNDVYGGHTNVLIPKSVNGYVVRGVSITSLSFGFPQVGWSGVKEVFVPIGMKFTKDYTTEISFEEAKPFFSKYGIKLTTY